jgi:hypothetical protein
LCGGIIKSNAKTIEDLVKEAELSEKSHSIYSTSSAESLEALF